MKQMTPALLRLLANADQGQHTRAYGIPASQWPTVLHRVEEKKDLLRKVADEYGVSHETIRRIMLHVQEQPVGPPTKDWLAHQMWQVHLQQDLMRETLSSSYIHLGTKVVPCSAVFPVQGHDKMSPLCIAGPIGTKQA